MLFGQGEVLDGPGKLPAPKLEKFIDPDPSHCLQHPTKEPKVSGEPQAIEASGRDERPTLSSSTATLARWTRQLEPSPAFMIAA